jgi:KDO2-lipid IV(A) lauroyltransferase
VGALRDAIDVVHTFSNFASCLTEALSSGSKSVDGPEATVHSSPRARRVLMTPGGAIMATAHTAGWEILGALLARDHHKQVMIVMQRERDDGARELHDTLRRLPRGVQLLHVGDDALECLPLIRHLRGGGVVAVQIDRVPAGMTGHPVRLFGQPAVIPEGPLRLAQLTGAPIVPAFSARTGHRRYVVEAREPIDVPRHADAATVDAAAQRLADALGDFVSAHPTQWFPFHE